MSDDTSEDSRTTITERARAGAQRIYEELVAVCARINKAVTWRRVKIFVGVVLAITLPIASVYGVYEVTGSIIDTIAYTLLFLVTFTIVPLTINLLGAETPGGAGLGKGHFILGNIAARQPYLVQAGDKYRLCIGTDDEYYLDGEWHDVDDGQRNRTILGWRQFSMVWHKQDEDVKEVRADRAVSDGGAPAVHRGDVTATSPPHGKMACPSCDETVGIDAEFCPQCGYTVGLDDEYAQPNEWLLSVHRLYGKGLEQIGNTDLLETAEEQAKRDEISGGVVSEWSRVIAALVGPLLGFVMGYVLFYV